MDQISCIPKLKGRGLQFIVGGLKSGKTYWAESIFKSNSHTNVTLLNENDLVTMHLEESDSFFAALSKKGIAIEGSSFCFDSLSLWLAAIITRDFEKYSAEQLGMHLNTMTTHALQTLKKLSETNNVVCIASNTADGVVPSHVSARLFRESNAQMCTKLASCSKVVFEMKYGLVQVLKGAQN
jgi:adenosyl cobinamide kinase/adenosyl cobinamide phosphate guanylyltransferase